MEDNSTKELFTTLQNAYNYFKQELFSSNLPPVILTLNRKVRSMGYYMPHAWIKKNSKDLVPELNINPDILNMPASEIMQTLVHEMCHHHQQYFGKPGKRGFHNIEFSRIMFSKGLMCSSTGKPGGKVTGRRMADYVIEGGAYSYAFMNMPDEYKLPFTSTQGKVFLPNPDESLISAEAKNRNKTKYQCPVCTTTIWGKPDLKIICGLCYKFFNAHPEKKSIL